MEMSAASEPLNFYISIYDLCIDYRIYITIIKELSRNETYV